MIIWERTELVGWDTTYMYMCSYNNVNPSHSFLSTTSFSYFVFQMNVHTIFFFKSTWNSFKKWCCAALLPYINSYFTTCTCCSGMNFAYIPFSVGCRVVTFWKKSSGIWKYACCRLEMAIRNHLAYTFFPAGCPFSWSGKTGGPAPHTRTFLQWHHCYSAHSNFICLWVVRTTLTRNRGHLIIPKILVFIRSDLFPPDSTLLDREQRNIIC